MISSKPLMMVSSCVVRVVLFCCRGNQPSQIPAYLLYIVSRFLRLSSLFAAYPFLLYPTVSPLLFVYFSLLGASLLFFALQRPWRGKRLTQSQVSA